MSGSNWSDHYVFLYPVAFVVLSLPIPMPENNSLFADPYFAAIFEPLDPKLAKESKDGLFYKTEFATSRRAVMNAAHIHMQILINLFKISQVPGKTRIENVLERSACRGVVTL